MVASYTKLLVRDLTFNVSIGVLAEEKRAPQPIIINIEAGLENYSGPKNDSIDEVLSYVDLVETAETIAKSRHINLVETLAEEIADNCLACFDLAYIKIRIEKPAVLANASVGIEIYRTK